MIADQIWLASPLFCRGNLTEHAGELVGAGCASAGAVDAAEALKGKTDRSAFEQGAQGLEVAVAAGQILQVMNPAVNQVKINQFGAYQRTRRGRNVPDAVINGVHNYSEIVSCHNLKSISDACQDDGGGGACIKFRDAVEMVPPKINPDGGDVWQNRRDRTSRNIS